MSHFHDLWHWMAALKTSLPFAIALPILVATVFASIVDWLERYLAADQQTASQHQADDPSASARQRYGRGGEQIARL